jgi:arsenate reductase
MSKPTLLSYASCSTCRKALAWLTAHGIEATVRPLVEDPPRVFELETWMPLAGLSTNKWLNTSGQSYRDLGGKATFEGMTDERVRAMLAGDGKLVKRPVLISGDTVLVGFDEAAYAEHFAAKKGKSSASKAVNLAPSAAPKKAPAKKVSAVKGTKPAVSKKKSAK